MPPYLSAAVSKLRVMGLPFLPIDCCLMPFLARNRCERQRETADARNVVWLVLAR
ncbi:hypothetical protein RBSWK_03155 [Rhodopirellula baltica SWK14]|uniref:Uncharacterized protein n=1 Tax=Rhodopirellula baltica SWK14 TaxID=993516 RepID=L7CFV9_RHOBT|nr:hypothetical protein RBSWK_03155 [Rhodopirellula baltica SWK14]